MSQVINTNIASLSAQRALGTSQGDVNQALQRLSSGLRINSAKDDAAGLAISERFNSQIKGLNQAVRNANDAVSLSQTAESALGETTALLQRARELSVQSANATNSSSDRKALQAEVSQIVAEIDRIATTTEFNGLKLLNGNFQNKAFQVGAQSNQTVSVTVNSAKASDLGQISTVNFANDQSAFAAAQAATSGISSPVAAQTLTFSVTDVGATAKETQVAIAADSSAATSAAAITAAVDGITATAKTSALVEILDADVDSGETVVLNINGTSVSFTTSAGTGANAVTALAAAIKSESSLAGLTVTTDGLTAVTSGDSLKIVDESGADIQIDIVSDSDSTSGFEANFKPLTAADTDGSGVPSGSFTASGAAAVGDSSVITGDITYTTDRAAGTTFSLKSSVAVASGGLAATSAGAGVVTVSSDRVSTLDISSASGAQSAIAVIDSAIAKVSSIRGNLGAIQNRFDSVVTSLQASAENQAGARSRIVDADFAAETAALTRGQILQQAGIAVLAQANAAPQNVLALLQ